MPHDLTALLGSRICHDLISPLGAIGNGVELLSLSGTAPGAEITLISESVANANARIRFFRVAFGASSDGQRIARAEIRAILSDLTRGGRMTVDWQAAGDPDRRAVKLAFLLIQCLETALAYGGRVTVTEDADTWTIAAGAAKLRAEPVLWDAFRAVAARPGAEPLASWATTITPATVHFALVPGTLVALGRTASVDIGDTAITLRF